jgi:hypothetical protein
MSEETPPNLACLFCDVKAVYIIPFDIYSFDIYLDTRISRKIDWAKSERTGNAA